MIDKNTIHEILRYGSMAPSIDNCQPWRFLLRSDHLIDIYLDKSRAEFFGDYAFMASYATIGALVENLVIAAAQRNLQAQVDAFPESNSDEPVVRITFSAAEMAADPLFAAIERRCTNRRPYRPVKLLPQALHNLQQVSDGNFRLLLVEEPEAIKRLARLAEAIDRVIFEHRLLHENLFRWMRWSESEWRRAGDGMGVAVLELPPADRAAFRLLSLWPVMNFLNYFGISRIVASKNSGLLHKSSALGLLIMKGPATKENFFQGGRLLERIWLQATLDGLAFQPYGGMAFLLTRLKLQGDDGFIPGHVASLQKVSNELVELAQMRADNTLLMLFRLGYADPPSARTPRRGLPEILSVG